MSSFYRISLRSSWSLLLLFFIAASVHGQDTTNISITGRNMPISGFIRQLESKTGFSFIYGKAAFDDQERVSLTLSNVGLSEVLSALFQGKNLSWQYREKTVILSRQAPQNSQVTADSAPQYSVAGTVVDPQGNPIEGASVALRGQSRGQGTNSKGEFSFSGIPENAVLVVSSIGYATKQLRLSGQREVRVALDTLVHEIEGVEVVSTGYQDIPKERATGSFVKLDNKLISRAISTNIIDRLKGIVPGLNFEPRAGERAISIRGNSTIEANPRPLIIIDGFPYDESSNFQNVLNNINPNDVENISILKDAAAASIWGARAGNGVIVITTKKGKYSQSPQLSFANSTNIIKKPDLFYIPTISAKDLVEFEKNRFETGYYNQFDDVYPTLNIYPAISKVAEVLLSKRRGEITQTQAQDKLNALSKHDVRDDINNFFSQNAVNQQFNLNISGGSDRYKYYTSIGYDRNSSNIKGVKYNRLTVRFENTFKVTQNLEVSTFITANNSKNSNNGFIPSGYSPYTFLADSLGNPMNVPRTIRENYPSTKGLVNWQYSPLQEIELMNDVTLQNDTRMGANIQLNVLRGLTAVIKTQFQKMISSSKNIWDMNSFDVRNLVNSYMQIDNMSQLAYPIPNASIINRNTSELNSWNLRGQLNYALNLKNHSISAIAGAEAREVKNSSNQARQYGYDSETGTTVSNIDFQKLYSIRNTFSQEAIPNLDKISNTLYRYISYFANVGYTFSEKYTISGSARVDGSNFFGIKANQRIVPLWSTGISWQISNESFYGIKAIPNLRIRATYGYNGNTNNSATSYSTMSYLAVNPLSNEIYAVIQTPPNPQLRWERIGITNIGMDFQTSNQKISGSVEYYYKHGIDMLGPVIVNSTTGFTSYTGNQASIKGEGIDLNITTLNVDRRVKWQTYLLFSYNTDKITEFQSVNSLNAGSYVGGTARIIGKPYNPLYSYKWAGLDPQNGAPRGYVADTVAPYNIVLAGNNTKPEDLTYNGQTSPKVFGALRNSISYRSFTLSLNIIYKFGYYFRRSSIRYQTLYVDSHASAHSDYAKRWIKPGDENITNIPSLPPTLNSAYDQFYANSEILAEKGDHVRLQDIRLSYIPKKSFNRHLKQYLEVFAYANNLGIIWRANNKGIDPDFNNGIPTPKSIAFGVNITF